MTPNSRYDIALSIAVFLLLLVGLYLLVVPQGAEPLIGKKTEEPIPAMTEKRASAHGGVVQPTQEFLVESVFRSDGLRLYLYDAEARPLSVKGVSGEARVEFSEKGRQEAVADLAYQGGPGEGAQDSLWAAVDFQGLRGNGATAKVHLAALPGVDETEADLSIPFRAAQLEERVPSPGEKEAPPSPQDRP